MPPCSRDKRWPPRWQSTTSSSDWQRGSDVDRLWAPSVIPPPRVDCRRHFFSNEWIHHLASLLTLRFTIIIITQLPFSATRAFPFGYYNTSHPERYGWAEFANYKKVFKNPQIPKDARQTIEWILSVALVPLILGLGIAMLLNRKFLAAGSCAP